MRDCSWSPSDLGYSCLEIPSCFMKHCTIAGPFPVLADLQEGINSDLVGITEVWRSMQVWVISFLMLRWLSKVQGDPCLMELACLVSFHCPEPLSLCGCSFDLECPATAPLSFMGCCRCRLLIAVLSDSSISILARLAGELTTSSSWCQGPGALLPCRLSPVLFMLYGYNVSTLRS